MGFVHQRRDFPVIGLGQSEQQGAEVEVIVVIGDHHVGPAGHFLAQVIRANPMFQSNLAQSILVQQAHFTGRLTRRWQAIVETLGQRAGFAVASLVRMLASLVPSDHLQNPQGRRIGAVENHLRGVKCQFAPRGFSGQEKHLVQLLRRQGFEHREQGTDGFADAGRRLSHQATAGTDGLEHRFGEMTLARAETGMGKFQLLRRAIAPFAMDHFLFGPVQKQQAMLLEKRLQLPGAERLDQAGFFFADDVKVDQRQIDLLKLQFLAHQPAVDLCLRPMQLTVVGRLLAQVATVGFDFLQAVLRRIVAVRPALDLQAFEQPFEGDFTLVALAAPGCHRAMADNTFQRRWRRCEAQVKVPDLGGELTQRPHGNAVAQASCSAHCT
ncbi:hypothetical protein D3C87_1345420 [compost metagenome]